MEFRRSAGSLDHFASYLLSRAGYDGTTYALFWRLSLFGPRSWRLALRSGGASVSSALRGSLGRWGQTFGQAFWGQWRYFWPLTSILTAFSAAVYVGWASTAALLVAAFIGWKLCSVYSEAAKGLDMQASIRATSMTASAVSRKGRRGITRGLDSPYRGLAATKRFACSGRQVVLSDSLVSSLTKSEVDAVAAHELRHLERRHPWALWDRLDSRSDRLLLCRLFGLALLMPGALSDGVFDIAFLVFSVLSLGFISRRFERTADDGAIEISEDPRSFITGQAKLAALHEAPERQGAFQELWSTHPSFRKRIERAAKKADVTLAQLEEWLHAPQEGGRALRIAGSPRR